MQTINIEPGILDIHFTHPEDLVKNSWIQIPSTVLEEIIRKYIDSLPGKKVSIAQVA
jgi:hypothetical protein